MNRKGTAVQAVIDDPLRLAEIYRAGVGRSWNSYREGAERLGSMNLRAGYTQLQQAVAIANFPRQILDLFKYTGLVNQTARALIRAKNKEGLDRVLQRALAIDPKGKSRTQLVALLSNDHVSSEAFRPTYSTEFPLLLDQCYRDGLTDGTWTSIRQAAKTIGLSVPRLANAVRIGKLPDEVKALFRKESLTFAEGWQLVQVEKVRGAEAIREAAISAGRVVPPLTQQGIMNRLIGLNGDSVQVKIRRGSSGKIVLEFHCDADDPSVETRLSLIVAGLQTLTQ